MTEKIEAIQDKIIEAVLPDVAFEGWTRAALAKAAVDSGYESSMADSVFPDGIAGALKHFAAMMDRGMMAGLTNIDPESLKIRERIRVAVLARLTALAPYREAERRAMAYWSSPFRLAAGGKVLWRTADLIWDWAGDKAQDYNRYTKRGLLSGVIAATVLAWLDNGGDQAATEAFLDRRIENVMQFGRILGKIKKTK